MPVELWAFGLKSRWWFDSAPEATKIQAKAQVSGLGFLLFCALVPACMCVTLHGHNAGFPVRGDHGFVAVAPCRG